MGERDSKKQDGLGESKEFLDFQNQLSRAARVDRSVLVIGERGSGKELAASRIHFLSKRWDGPLVTLNCAALPPALIETELFGHESGAYTGASGRRKGRFEEAHGGTLFLDEIGLIPLEVQEKILRVVEYGSFERVGSSKPIEVDVRIVGATNADLPALCEEGKFKRDLLDRLSFEVLFIPPLRVRKGDINLLAFYFANRMALELGIEESAEFTEEVLNQLNQYTWPGNVRELKNVVERAVYRSESFPIGCVRFDPFDNPYTHDSSVLPPTDDLGRFKEVIRQMEISFVQASLERSRYNQKKAAEQLGVTYDQFRGLYRKYSDLLSEPD
ncbi:MAG: sigma 54-interacting transcriptional regulator [Spirochaetales bacterium]|nr:sigma 54-interacting transcriptional regulator [Spirochaetales bacterium]